MEHIRIAGIAHYHPETTLDNEYFYKLYGKENVNGLLEASGKKQRYVSMDFDENSLTMGIIAAQRVLKKCKLEGKDLDFIVFTSTTLEYLLPTSAIKIHRALNASERCGAYDMNANCDSMVILMDQYAKIMKLTKGMNRVLIVGSDLFYRYTPENDSFTHSIFSDAASAIILEKTSEATSDIMDSIYFTDNSCHDHVYFPKYGFSNTLAENKEHRIITDKDKLINWGIGDADKVYSACENDVRTIVKENHLSLKDLKGIFMCQMFQSKIHHIAKNLELDNGLFPYIADEYGYTGVSSPLIALEKSIDNQSIKRGDPIVLWGLGAGITTITLLLRY